MDNTNEITKSSLLNSLAGMVLMVAAIISPFFFIPNPTFSLPFSKMTLIVFAVLVSGLLMLIDRLRKGSLEMPYGRLVLAGMCVPASYLLASLFSSTRAVSFIGQGFETETFFGILILFLIMFLVPVFFKENRQLMKLYIGLFVSFVVVSIFQILRMIFGVDFLSFNGLFSGNISNLVGKWNDLGIFFGLFALMSLSSLELLKVSRLFKVFLYITLLISLFFSAIINFTTVWVVLAIGALFFFVWKGVLGESDQSDDVQTWSLSRFFSPATLVVFVISLVFIIAGGFLGDVISEKFNISQVEARPSWESTLNIGGEALKEDVLFGAGPNRFQNVWLSNKPVGINNTIFWNTDFVSGIGTIPSSITTTGLVGIFSWIAFLSLLLLHGLRRILLSRKEDLLTRYIGVSSFLAAAYLWTFSIFYVPNITILTLSFLLTGIFISSEIMSGKMSMMKINFLQNPKIGFVSVFAIVVLLIGGVGLGYVYAKKYVSFVVFQSGIVAFNVEGDIDLAEEKLLSAVRLSESDLYYRALAQLDIARLNEVVSQTDVPEDTLRTQFGAVLGAAIDNAVSATSVDPMNYQNWRSLGQVYGSIVSLGVEGSYQSAKDAYERALELNPHSPSLYLTLARLEAANNDTAAAREYINSAIEQKNNYTEAVFFLSQVEIAEGNTDAAISSVEAASAIAPNDATIFFQLGLLRYNNGQFERAVVALERAVSLSSTYSNAKYFLGLSYYDLGRVEDSIGQFEDVATLNPGNDEVKTILTRLKNGESPLEDLNSQNNRLEDIEALPIEE